MIIPIIATQAFCSIFNQWDFLFCRNFYELFETHRKSKCVHRHDCCNPATGIFVEHIIPRLYALIVEEVRYCLRGQTHRIMINIKEYRMCKNV